MGIDVYSFLAVGLETKEVFEKTTKNKEEVLKMKKYGELVGFYDDEYIGVYVTDIINILHLESIEMEEEEFICEVKKATKMFKELTGLDGKVMLLGHTSI